MAQTRANRPRSASTVKTSATAKGNRNVNPQQLILELKQRVIQVLNKLADRDTYQIASEELGRIAETLTLESFGPFLTCIFETDSQHKSIVRRECVKVFATLAACHGELLAPYMSKMVGNIIRRLKDPDSNVRDACVDAIGVLASKIMHPSGNSGVENGGTFSVFVKPLFEALAEQNRQLQVGSALCLARVIDKAKDTPVATLQKILPRIMKLLTNQNFSANAALLTAIGSIAQAGGASSQQTLAALVRCMLDTLKSNDWTTRKAAAEAFERMALSLGPLLSSFKSSCVTALESCRFDKVKPVRDTVIQTLQAWNSIPDAEVSSPLHVKGSIEKGKLNLSKEASSIDLKSAGSAGQKSTFLRKSGSAVTKSAIDGISISTARKRTPLTDTKITPGLPPSLNCRKRDNWNIEIAVPRNCPPISVTRNEEFNNTHCSEESAHNERALIIDDNYRFENTERFGKMDTSRLSDESRASCETKCILVDNAFEGKSSRAGTPNSKPPTELTHNKTSEQSNKINQLSNCSISESNSRYSTNFAEDSISRNSEDLAFIRKQLAQIENQQSSLMELLKVFMGSSLDSITTLETRVHGLEKIVDEMAQDLAKSTDRVEGGNKCRRSLGAEMVRSKFWKKNEYICPSSRLSSSDTNPSIHKLGRESYYKPELGSTGSWENLKYGSLQSSLKVKPLVHAWEMSYKGHVDSSPDSVGRPMTGNAEINQSLPKALEINSLKEKFGKDSVRNCLLASTGHSSLFGTYFTAEDSQTKMTEVRSSRLNLSVISPLCSSYENGRFWSVWRRAVEYLCAKDIDSAFVEVMRSEDDLLLIQLMKRTGPVVGNLSQGTTNEILQTVLRLLLDQKFLETIIPWLQQVVDMHSDNGPDFLGLSLGEKVETLSVLQEALSMHFSDLSSWSSVMQIASKLANIWATDLRSIS